MPTTLTRILCTAGLTLMLGWSPAYATIIRYQATNLTDVGTGDLWEYQYQVSNRAFLSGQGFDILFDLGDGDLETSPTSPGVDWDILTIQPDPGLPDDGRYDALALFDDPELSVFFTVQFLWHGSGTPGSQRFKIYDSRFQPIETIETGVTIPFGATVPEPGTLALTVLGWLALARRRRA